MTLCLILSLEKGFDEHLIKFGLVWFKGQMLSEYRTWSDRTYWLD